MFLAGEERDAAQILSDSLARDGLEIHLNTQVVAVRRQANRRSSTLSATDNKTSVVVDEDSRRHWART